MSTTQDRCREARLLASCELDGELSELGAARLRDHLAECGDCARWVTEAQQLAELLRSSEPVPFGQEIRPAALRRRLSGASRLVAAGASAAAAALAAVLIGFPAGAGPEQSSLPSGGQFAFTAGSGSMASSDSHLVLTTFKQAMVVPAPGGVRNLSIKIE